MPPKPKRKHDQAREGDEVVESFGDVSIMRSAGGGEYLTGPGALSIDPEDTEAVERAGRGRSAQHRQNLTKAAERARGRWGRG